MGCQSTFSCFYISYFGEFVVFGLFFVYSQVVVSFVVLALAQPKNLVCDSCLERQSKPSCSVESNSERYLGNLGGWEPIHEASRPPDVFVCLFCSIRRCCSSLLFETA